MTRPFSCQRSPTDCVARSCSDHFPSSSAPVMLRLEWLYEWSPSHRSSCFQILLALLPAPLGKNLQVEGTSEVVETNPQKKKMDDEI